MRIPEVGGSEWREALGWQIGSETVERIDTLVEANVGFSIVCFRCQEEITPWNGDELYVDTLHLEEYFGVPMETPGRVLPEKKLRQAVFQLYDRKCFGCDRSDVKLHIDHIMLQSKGGDAAFRNLQPLCIQCGNEKGDREPAEIWIYSDTPFVSYPSDGQEALLPED